MHEVPDQRQANRIMVLQVQHFLRPLGRLRLGHLFEEASEHGHISRQAQSVSFPLGLPGILRALSHLRISLGDLGRVRHRHRGRNMIRVESAASWREGTVQQGQVLAKVIMIVPQLADANA